VDNFKNSNQNYFNVCNIAYRMKTYSLTFLFIGDFRIVDGFAFDKYEGYPGKIVGTASGFKRTLSLFIR
jgi:hypothetical protein